MNWCLLLSGFLISSILFSSICHSALGNVDADISILYDQANKHLQNGELREAVNIYDEILLISPENVDALLMKGIALSNLDRHKQSMKELYKVLEHEPQNISALLGMGVGFGNFGEYKEAQKYFDSAYSVVPENHVVINYKNFAENV